MKNRYQTLKELQEFNRMFALGIIPIHVLDWIVIYEFWLIERETNGKLQSYSNTAENYKMSERQIMNVVSWMQGC